MSPISVTQEPHNFAPVWGHKSHRFGLGLDAPIALGRLLRDGTDRRKEVEGPIRVKNATTQDAVIGVV